MPTQMRIVRLNNMSTSAQQGRFGPYGGRYVPETLMPALDELEQAYTKIKDDPAFQGEIKHLLNTYAGRPTPLYYAKNLSENYGKAQIYLKREDLTHTGAHKINNALGQALLAKHMGKQRSIAETGAGQHGVAAATACAMLGLDCIVYMGEEDIKRQASNVFRMQLLGADVRTVTLGARTLKDAINEALRDWVTNVGNTYYMLGSAVGPHPYPTIVRDFQVCIGLEVIKQMHDLNGHLPDYGIACVGGGSNAIGLFHPLLQHPKVQLIGVEAGGTSIEAGLHAAPLTAGTPGVLHGALSYLLQDQWGQVRDTQSISAGLDYPGVGPEHSYLKDSNQVNYVSVNDNEALNAFHVLSRTEGILPALESSHAIAYAMKLAPTLTEGSIIVVNLSGRGDKDMETVAKATKI